jgi:hypothetical protein
MLDQEVFVLNLKAFYELGYAAAGRHSFGKPIHFNVNQACTPEGSYSIKLSLPHSKVESSRAHPGEEKATVLVPTSFLAKRKERPCRPFSNAIWRALFET